MFEPFDGRQFGHGHGGGQQTHAADAVGQFDLVRQCGLGLEQVGDLFFELGQGGVELPDVLAQMFGAEGIGGFEPVAALLFLVQEEAAGADEVLQPAFAFGDGFPRARVLAGAEVGDERGVNRVVLGAHQAAVGVVAGAAGVDQADGVAVLMEVPGECVAVAAGGFQAGVQGRAAMFGQPGVQGFETLGVVGKGGRMARAFGGGGPQAHVELVFGDVDAEDMGGWHVRVDFGGLCLCASRLVGAARQAIQLV